MSKTKRMKQMAHLKQRQISDSSCKAIIIDTLLETVRPLTQKELSCEITALFHILVSKERLNQIIESLCNDGIIFLDAENHISIVETKQTEFMVARLQEINLRKKAAQLWLCHIRSFKELSIELETVLSQALPVFLRSLFIKHGVSSYELLTSVGEGLAFDLKQIAKNVATQFSEEHRSDIESLLPTIFQVLDESPVVEYLKHSIEKAVGYISEIISDDNLGQLTDELKNLVIYLDTNTIYRLLNLQGTSRYEAIKETLDFCRANGVKLKVSALTKKELSARLAYDARVLVKYPTKTDLTQVGYNYRTSDNYVSTYWLQAKMNRISVDDFISYYQSFDLLLDAEQIEIENIEIDEVTLIDKTRHYFEKLSLRDPLHEKSDASLWHDAYSIAYIQKMQKADAKSAIDTRCLFLTTDHALTSFQREDNELKNKAPIVIAPSQLLQMFAFSKAESGYEETFIKFFASSSLGVTFKYSNDDIQEILSRIGHYQGVNLEVAEKILARQLMSSRYSSATSDEEKEEIIYSCLEEELLFELDLKREEVVSLESKNVRLDGDYKAALELLAENEELFKKEKLQLQTEAAEAEKRREAEATAREKAETSVQEMEEYSADQEAFYVNEHLEKWKKGHVAMFWIGVILSGVVLAVSIILSLRTDNLGWLGLLAILTITVPIVGFGSKAFSSKTRYDEENAILKDYRNKVKALKK